MTSRERRKTTQRVSLLLAGPLVAVSAVGVAAFGHQSSSASSPSSMPSGAALAIRVGAPAFEVGPAAPRAVATQPFEVLDGQHRGGLGRADGALPDHASVFNDALPGVANLDPALLRALRRAANDAAQNGIVFNVNSGWRSKAYQEQLLQQAIDKYGSRKAAARWVATPDTSPHVSGHAVDIGPTDAAAWLSRHGVRYGLCPIYRNEPWHYELRPDAIDRRCPALFADPSHDPRLQQ